MGFSFKFFFGSVVIILIFLFSSLALANTKMTYLCGVANGFPPYQSVDSSGKAVGLDVEVAALVFKTAGLQVEFVHDDWENLLFNLIHKKTNIDMLCGVEITPERQRKLNFTTPYFKRKTVLFVLKDGPVKKLEDLFGKIVAGDLHSSFEKKLGDKASKIRITKTISKEESFQRLKDKSVVAVIAPLEVGIYLAKKLNIHVHIFDEEDPGSAVGIAVKPGNDEVLNVLNLSIKKLLENGELDKILKRHQTKIKSNTPPQTIQATKLDVRLSNN